MCMSYHNQDHYPPAAFLGDQLSVVKSNQNLLPFYAQICPFLSIYAPQ